MSRLENLLDERFSLTPSKKVQQLAQKSSQGELSTAATLFTARTPTSQEVEAMEELLKQFATSNKAVTQDAEKLVSLSLEAKAINHQAALLHGERIGLAKSIFKSYREGAFSLWLVQTYGNRQTPYNFLLYFELHQILARSLQKKLEEMPKACAYALASRNGSVEDKSAIIQEYATKSRKELFDEIQRRFPLASTDKRKKQHGQSLLRELKSIYNDLKKHKNALSSSDKRELHILLDAIKDLI